MRREHSESGSRGEVRPPRWNTTGTVICIAIPENRDGTPANGEHQHRDDEGTDHGVLSHKSPGPQPDEHQNEPENRDENQKEKTTVGGIVHAYVTSAPRSPQNRGRQQGNGQHNPRAETSTQSSATHTATLLIDRIKNHRTRSQSQLYPNARQSPKGSIRPMQNESSPHRTAFSTSSSPGPLPSRTSARPYRSPQNGTVPW